jgi:hypothetical protein
VGDNATVSASAHSHSLQLQKSPSRVFGQNSGNSADISKAFFEMGISKFESSQVSQPVSRSEKKSLILRERPANGGLLRIGYRLQAPNLATIAARTPKVSGYMPKYSRFRETATGDWVRSSLHGGVGSASRRKGPLMGSVC